MKNKLKNMKKWSKKNAFLIFVFIAACVLILPNLGDRFFWGDETAFVLFSEKVVQNGYPTTEGLLGINEALDNPLVQRTDQVYTYHPWLTFYVMAIPISLFGKFNEFAIRLPFALLGVFSIILVYFVSLEFGLKKKAAKIATILMLTSTALYLHARNANYYSLAVFLALVMIYFYLKFLKENKIRNIIFFTISAILFFYTQFLIFLGVFAGIFIHFMYVMYKMRLSRESHSQKLKQGFFSALCIILFTVPWIIFANITKQTSYMSIKAVVFNNVTGWFFIFIFAFPFIFLFLLPYIFKKNFSYLKYTGKIGLIKRTKKQNKDNNKSYKNNKNSKKNPEFLILIPLMVVVFIGIISLNTMTPPTVRYLLTIFPLIYILIAAIIAWIYEKNRTIALVLIALVILSNLLNIVLFIFMKGVAQKNLELNGYSDASEKNFLDKTISPKSYFMMYLYEITHDYKSATGESVSYINENSDKSKIKSMKIFTNVDQMVHGFYTGINSTAKYEKLCTETFDWVVLYEKSALNHPEVNRCFNRGSYEKVAEINNNADDWVETPDLTSHRFITKRDSIIIIYKLKE